MCRSFSTERVAVASVMFSKYRSNLDNFFSTYRRKAGVTAMFFPLTTIRITPLLSFYYILFPDGTENPKG
jgi:hypothetical protein